MPIPGADEEMDVSGCRGARRGERGVSISTVDTNRRYSRCSTKTLCKPIYRAYSRRDAPQNRRASAADAGFPKVGV